MIRIRVLGGVLAVLLATGGAVANPLGGNGQERISLNFRDADVRAVLQAIAEFTGLNIIASETVSGTTTLRLVDVPWQQALDLVLASRDLAARRTGDVILIAPRDELAAREKRDLEAQAQRAELEPLTTASIQLNYQRAEALKTLLTDGGQKILSKRGSVTADARTNRIFILDTAGRIAEVRRLIADTDVPVRQVMIEARIVEATDTFGRNLGVRLGVNDLSARAGGTPGVGGGTRLLIGGGFPGAGGIAGQTGQTSNTSSTTTGTGNFATTTTPAVDALQSLMVNLPAAAIRGASPGTFSLSLFNSSLTRFLNLEVSALEADGKGRVVSSPRVVTADQEEANIEQGTEIPFQLATSSGATAVTFKKATLSLKVRPQITPDNHIVMNLRVNKDSPNFNNNTPFGPPIDTKQIQTQVLVENGGTVVIGGILTEATLSNTAKVPFLGDLPVIGAAFRNRSRQQEKTELLIFVTPRIVEHAPIVADQGTASAD